MKTDTHQTRFDSQLTARNARRPPLGVGNGRSSQPTSRGLQLLVVDANFRFSQALARLAEARGMPVTLCWSLEEVKTLSHLRFNAAIIEEDLWHALSMRAHEKLWPRFEAAQTVVICEELPQDSRQQSQRHAGPGAALELLLRNLKTENAAEAAH